MFWKIASGGRHCNKTLALLCLLLFACYEPWAQVLPKEGSLVNYRLVGFKEQGAVKVEIATGHHDDEATFIKNRIHSAAAENGKAVLELPSFGTQYTWRTITAANKHGVFHYFGTAAAPAVDTHAVRLRVVKGAAPQYEDDYVFADGTGVLYDMAGLPVWFLPAAVSGGFPIRDLKLSPSGTITFLKCDPARPQALEINYDGDILWKAPDNGAVSGDSTEHYHHEFTKLANGHYMVMGSQIAPWKPNATSGPASPDGKARNTPMAPFGTLIEYDKAGKVVWSWKSLPYILQCDLKYYRNPNGMPVLDAHDNAFFFDERARVIYMSFKNISRVIKISYPGGEVLDAYGDVYEEGGGIKSGNGFFCDQHSCRRSQKGRLYLFNNNDCHPGSPPSIVVMKETGPDNSQLQKIWEYSIGGAPAMAAGGRQPHSIGGNVVELPDESIFASFCNPYGNTLIVSPGKELLWEAVPEKKNPDTNQWETAPQYRASIMTRKELLGVVWGGGR